ncbi:MAG TPA: hypothetical protein VKY92_04760, partial [Verrucomicrobiae bacterium]|nr:hypothetical protein [Verrucomicrobiae bacterium]
MKRFSLGLFVTIGFLGSAGTGRADSLTWEWDMDPDPDVVAYQVYYGPASGQYTNSAFAGSSNMATVD